MKFSPTFICVGTLPPPTLSEAGFSNILWFDTTTNTLKYTTNGTAWTAVAPSSTGGGSFTSYQATVIVPYPANKVAKVNVINALVSITSKIIISLAGVAETQTNAGIEISSLSAIPLSGSFDVQFEFLQPSAGPVVLNYAIG